ncbi:MAG: hypothetical protein EXR99_16245 [Gemmataceae bacterium]|nr:hypothetical protein [Gemmataceae bacterium]
MRITALFLLLNIGASLALAGTPPLYLWFEPEWFPGVEGSFSYWSDSTKPGKPTGAWGIAGPGISAEWTQGGESEWNSIGVCAEEKQARCGREFIVPRTGKYRLWIRYVDHRNKSEPFFASIEQKGNPQAKGAFGHQPLVPPNDEYQLYWGFSFGWGSTPVKLQAGPAQLTLGVDQVGEAWRQIDAVLITDDLGYEPRGREKPPFAYLASFPLEPRGGKAWRGSAKNFPTGQSWKRPPLAGKDFTMWAGGVEPDPKWWGAQKLETLSPFDVFFHFCPPADIRPQFHKQFVGKKDLPILSWPGLRPVLYLGNSPDLSSTSPLRQWLEKSKTPFAILTNYANPQYKDKAGPETFQALTGPLEGQFLGYIHGEAVGTSGQSMPTRPLASNRREHVDAFIKHLKENQAKAWSGIYKTAVPANHFDKGISCLSTDSIALAHAFHEAGMKTVGYEEDATNIHVPMRIAFERGAARQYGQAWINYASGNFGDACNYFTQNPVVNRGAQGWYHSKYAVTDGVNISWYRKLYYLNYLGGASAIFWEQGLGNQFMLPGPGAHPVQLSPFGRATEEFLATVDRIPNRGEPFTPIALLLSHGHAYDRVNYACKMLHAFQENINDIELREWFNVLWHPAGVVEGMPAHPDASLPSGCFGNLFDVLVDRPNRAKALLDYPIVWAGGDASLAPLLPTLKEYLEKGGTLVLPAHLAKQLPANLLGFQFTGKSQNEDTWTPEGGVSQSATPFEVTEVKMQGARVLATAGAKVPLLTRNAVGEGAVITLLVPHQIGLDERAHPALPYLLNGLTQDLLPVEVRLADGSRPKGEIMYQINRAPDGWIVALLNNRGVDKTQNGVARVDRNQWVDIILRSKTAAVSVKELTQPRTLLSKTPGKIEEAFLRVHPGDVQVVHWKTH